LSHQINTPPRGGKKEDPARKTKGGVSDTLITRGQGRTERSAEENIWRAGGSQEGSAGRFALSRLFLTVHPLHLLGK
jgi:hypothetical protein